MKKFLSTLVCLSLFIHYSEAQMAGSIDSSFGVNGIAAGTLVPDFLQFGDVKIQDDGKILIMSRMKNGSDYDVVMMRVDSNGTPDNSFGTNGEEEIITSSVSEFPVAAAIQSDGKILVGGGTGQEAFVGRFNVDGSLDQNFGTDGWTYTAAPNSSYGDVYGMYVLPDGKILAAGNSFGTADVFRLDQNGKVDSTFGVSGHALFPGVTVFCMTVQPDEKILVGGRTSFCCIARFTAEGTIDSTFGTNGIVQTDINGQLSWFQKIFVLADGKLIGAGAAYTANPLVIQYVTARYDQDGILDNSYATNGFSITSFSSYFIIVPTSAALESDDKVLFTGEVVLNSGELTRFMLLRLTANGTVDTGFGTDGVTISSFGSTNYGFPIAVTFQANGKIIVAGRIDNNGPYVLAAVRYFSGTTTGIQEEEFSGVSDFTTYPNPTAENIRIEYSLVKSEIISIELRDVTGRILQAITNKEYQRPGNHHVEISFSNLIPAGIYFINIGNETSSQTIQVVKE